MKKYLLMVVALTIGVVAQAQIVTSTSSIIKKAEKKTRWYFKPGFSVMTMGGDGADGADAKIGYNGVLGFQKTIKQKGAYWGMEVGLGSRGFSADGTSAIAHNVQFSPFTFGWMVDLGCDGKLRIDPHLGVYASCDYISSWDGPDWNYVAHHMGNKYDDHDYNIYDVGMNLGVGIWYSRFNFDITWQRGFIDAITNCDGFKTNNVLFRIGVSF